MNSPSQALRDIIHSLICLLVHSFICSLTYSFTHSLTHLFTLVHSLICSLIHSLIHPSNIYWSPLCSRHGAGHSGFDWEATADRHLSPWVWGLRGTGRHKSSNLVSKTE